MHFYGHGSSFLYHSSDVCISADMDTLIKSNNDIFVMANLYLAMSISSLCAFLYCKSVRGFRARGIKIPRLLHKRWPGVLYSLKRLLTIDQMSIFTRKSKKRRPTSIFRAFLQKLFVGETTWRRIWICERFGYELV